MEVKHTFSNRYLIQGLLEFQFTTLFYSVDCQPGVERSYKDHFWGLRDICTEKYVQKDKQIFC